MKEKDMFFYSENGSENYCKNKDAMKKMAKEESLNRILWRFSVENGWDYSLFEKEDMKYVIYYSHLFNEYRTLETYKAEFIGAVYFVSEEIAKRAIDEIIIPFERGELSIYKLFNE